MPKILVFVFVSVTRKGLLSLPRPSTPLTFSCLGPLWPLKKGARLSVPRRPPALVSSDPGWAAQGGSGEAKGQLSLLMGTTKPTLPGSFSLTPGYGKRRVFQGLAALPIPPGPFSLKLLTGKALKYFSGLFGARCRARPGPGYATAVRDKLPLLQLFCLAQTSFSSAKPLKIEICPPSLS